MAEQEYREWQCPAAATDEAKRVGWINEACEEGQAWLKAQRGYSDFKRALDVISGRMSDVVPEYRSKLNTNRLKRNIREVVGTLSKLRPMWGYHSDNNAFIAQAELMNKVTRAWYLEAFADRSIKEALQYAAATCTGYVRPVYRRAMYGAGKGDIALLTYGSPCVLPVQLPANRDLQSAYAVTILDEMPIAMAHGMFPAFQDKLRPTSSQYWYASEIRSAAKGNMFKRIWGSLSGSGSASVQGLADLFIPIRYTYVIDLAINNTGQAIPMGEPGTSWFYNVPAMGSGIPAGEDSNGTPVFRIANENDSRLYPYRRLLISSETVVLYDGPAFDWHGMVPLVRFCVDDWPWEPIGFSLIRDGYDIQVAVNELERGVMDIHRSRLDMPLGYDINAVTRKEATQFDPMQPRSRVGFDGNAAEKPFVPLMDPQVLQVSPETMNFLQHLLNSMDHQLAIKDIMALAKARALGSGDNVEKIMEMNGPIVEDISRSMEAPMRDLGSMIKYLILQYYTSARIMQIVGPDGMTPETFDYDPDSLIPSHMPDENPDKPSLMDRPQRARVFADNLRFFIMPNSLHELMQMTQKLLYLQLKRTGFPIDSRTVAEALNIPNFGNKPEGNTVWERWQNEQELLLMFAARMKELGGSLPGMAAGPPGAGGAGVSAQNKGAGGRPPSGNAPPQIQSKDGGSRTTVTESGK